MPPFLQGSDWHSSTSAERRCAQSRARAGRQNKKSGEMPFLLPMSFTALNSPGQRQPHMGLDRGATRMGKAGAVELCRDTTSHK